MTNANGHARKVQRTDARLHRDSTRHLLQTNGMHATVHTLSMLNETTNTRAYIQCVHFP